MQRFLLICAISLFVSAVANAQIHPANSALASASPTLAPPLPSGNGSGNGDASITSTVFEGPTRFEAGVEYNWTGYNEFPNNQVSMNGFVGSISWFFFRDVGVEGQLAGGVGNTDGYTAKFVFLGAGVHARFENDTRFQPWVHALVGHVHFLPQTPYGSQGALGWEAGGGLDYHMLNWLSLRVGADALGSELFGTQQVSPMVHGGVVFNF